MVKHFQNTALHFFEKRAKITMKPNTVSTFKKCLSGLYI